MVENPNRKVEKLLPEERLGGNGLFVRITVFPGREIDYHEHHGETETYHIIAGEGVYGDNGAERAFYADSRIYTGYSHKVWQYQCQWDQQNYFAQQGYENRNFCLSQGYKHILAGSLQSENSHTTQENRHCPADCFYQSFITRKGGSYC